MPYVDRLLATDERIVRRERQHWLWPVLEAIRGVAILAVAVVGFLLAWAVGGTLGQVLAWLALVALLMGLAWLAWAVLRWQNEEYVITTRRVIQAEGILNKKASDSSLDKINDAQIAVPFVGRLLGFGDLEVMTASETGIERFRLLRDPVDFKRAMLDAKADLEYDLARPRMPSPPLRSDGGAPSMTRTDAEASPARATAAGPPAPPTTGAGKPSGEDVTRTLAALADLRDRGAITPEEYEAKKTELLARL
jgi:uncharacterized membrane protein